MKKSFPRGYRISLGHQAGARALGRLVTAGLAVATFAGGTLRAQNYGFSILAGAGAVIDHTDGGGGNARFLNPTAVAVDPSGNIYIADGGDHTIRKVSSGGEVTTLAGSSGQPGSSDGIG